jgi:23S rRNA pseudouridine1911/1915/1917 synthase
MTRSELEVRFELEPGEPAVWEISPQEAGERIDKYLAEMLEGTASRSQVQGWIRDGFVRVGGKSVKPNYRLEDGDELAVTMPEPEPAEVDPEDIPVEIMYEDRDVVVVNKPRGMVVHPAPGHARGTLVNALLYHCRDLSGVGGLKRPGIVHRIDKDTSGLLMAAKNDIAHQKLSEQLAEHSVIRKYLAIVTGRLPHDRGTIDAPIGRDPRDRKKFAVNAKNGKPAITHFTVLERFADHTFVELRLETGRTHQIRVHMQYIGHPLEGDPVYGRRRKALLDGQALHAAVLGFRHPANGEQMLFEAPLPGDMERLLALLRGA